MNTHAKILAVDDDHAILSATRRALEAAGYETLEARDGEEALRAVHEHKPDLMLLDVNIPKLDGFEVCRRVKADPALAGTFIIIMTSTRTDSDSRVEGLNMGADGYIGRPIANRELLARVQAMLRIQAVEKALRQSESRFQILAEVAPVGIFRTDPNGNTDYVNPRWSEISQLSFEAALGKSWLSAVHPDDRELVGETWQKAALAQALSKTEYRFLHRDGSIAWVMGQAVPQKDANGSIVGYIGTITDITERKQAEDALRESEERYRSLFDRMMDGVYRSTHEGKFLDVNQAMVKMFGYSSKEEMLNVDIRNELYFAPDERGSHVLDTGQEEMDVYRMRRKDGSEIWIEDHGFYVHDRQGAIIYHEGMLREITERKRAEEALRESEDKFKYVFDHSVTGKSITLPSGELNINQAFCDMLGYSQDEIKNHKWQEITHPEDVELTQTEINALLSNLRESTRFVKRYLHKDGSIIWTEESTALRRDADGKPLYFMTSINDITARKQTEDALRESENRFRALIENNVDAITLLDANGIALYDSPAAPGMLGYTPEDWIGQDVFALIHPDDLPKSRELFKNLTETPGTRVNLTLRLRHKSGTWQWIEMVATNLLTEPGVKAIVLNYRDITERKREEVALVASEDRYRLLVDFSPDAIMIHQQGKFVYVNPATLALLGAATPDDLLGKPILEFVHPDYWEIVRTRVQKALEKGEKPPLIEERFIRLDGSAVEVEAAAIPIQYEGWTAIQVVAHDITGRKRAGAALRESEAFSQAILDNSPIGISVRSQTGQLLSANEAWRKIWAMPESDLLEDRTQERQTLNFDARDAYLEPHQDEVRRVYQQGGHLHLPELKTAHTRPGAAEWISQHFYAIQDERGQVKRVVILTEDITARKRAEDALETERNLLWTLIDNLPDRIYAKDLQGRKTLSNTADWQASGVKDPQDVIGKLDSDLYPPELAAQFTADDQAVMNSGIPIINREVPGLDAHGSPVWILSTKVTLRDSQGKTLGMVGIGRDITERKQVEDEVRQLNAELEERIEARTRELRETQEQLVRQEKLAVLGQLAGGVGHELRNPLSVINNAIYFLRLAQPEADEKVKEYLGIIETETHIADKIISDLLDFSRIKSVDVEPVTVAELVKRVLERFPAREGVSVTLKIPESLPTVYADPRQMTQILGNLVVNACQAMTTGGKLIISATKKSKEIAIAVKDTGMGIPPENMKKLFEPLFTTKAKGIGLGLAVSRKLVEANSGRIEVQSKPGKGSTFTIFLPIHNEN